MRLKYINKKKIIRVGMLLTSFGALLISLHSVIVYLVRERVYNRTLVFEDQSVNKASKNLTQQVSILPSSEYSALEKANPFLKFDSFGEDAYSWTNQFSQYGAAGILVFDANGDGRLDVYFCQDGQNWTRPTDKTGLLKDQPRFQHNGLFLNQGNNDKGNPIFKQISELVSLNNTFVKEELLVEDYLYPRERPGDSHQRFGRGSNLAVAADFNNDGLMDLLVGNEPKGMFWSDPKTQRVLMRFVNPVGREDKKSKQPLSAMGLHLINYSPKQSIYDKRISDRGEEMEGANSLYINIGDRDEDGIPEWYDASRETGIEGSRATYSIAVADIDLDGDLDIFVANTSDMDYWPGGSKYWAGGANRLYINELAETGKLNFVEKAGEMDVDGVYDDEYPMPYYYRLRKLPFLSPEYSILFMKFEPYQPKYLVINGQEAEHGQISWSSVFQDVNQDGYPDIWIANDMGYLRLYLNQKGHKFVRTEHARSIRSGYWMTFAPGDYNGDLKEDLFAGNLGGAVMNHAFVTPDPYDLFQPVLLNTTIFAQFFNDKHDTRHGLIDGADFKRELPNKIKHSQILPPDVTLSNNYRRHAPESLKLTPFDSNTINAYEFAWGATSFDIQNDGKLDIYYIGCLYGRGGGLFPMSGTGPGRLLVNATIESDKLRFVDLTAEYNLFNIEELKYDNLDSGRYIYRKSPSKNWQKRDLVYSYDRSNWVMQGPKIKEKVTNQDLIQTAENGRSVVAADLDNDGFMDLIIRNQGGYDSRGSSATNLKTLIGGKAKVIPAHNINYPVPTNYEPGRTCLFLNQHSSNNWIKVKLIDDSNNSYNRNAIGAKIIVNDQYLRINRCGNGGFLSNSTSDIHFGIGKDPATKLKIFWPDKNNTITNLRLQNLINKTITISKIRGLVEVK